MEADERLCRPHGRDQQADAHDLRDAFEIVGHRVRYSGQSFYRVLCDIAHGGNWHRHFAFTAPFEPGLDAKTANEPDRERFEFGLTTSGLGLIRTLTARRVGLWRIIGS